MCSKQVYFPTQNGVELLKTNERKVSNIFKLSGYVDSIITKEIPDCSLKLSVTERSIYEETTHGCHNQLITACTINLKKYKGDKL